ncbi:MAG TPA: ferritin-like domain-containing protein, partial [Planctomycetota bacterium]|nr:ferritin-like domain-containing protein [Planctomycetota bacterium]
MKDTIKTDFTVDVDELRQRAREHIENGAVTGDYQANRETVIKLLNEALATELVCVLRYTHDHHMAIGIHADPVSAEFAEHAKEEQEHADRLAGRITQLGGEPDYNPEGLRTRSHSEYVVRRSLIDMIRENLVAERIAIDSYSQMIRYVGDGDPTTRRLLEDILSMEEEHAKDLADLLVTLDPTEKTAPPGSE